MAEDRLATILNRITDGITVQDWRGNMLYANDAAAQMVGCVSAADFLSTSPVELLERFEMFDENQQPFDASLLPGRIAITAGTDSEQLIGFRIKKTGEVRWSKVRATAVLDDNGKVELAINVFRDETERRALESERERVRRHLAFVSHATQALDEGPLDAESRLLRLARLAVPSLAEWCAVYLAREDRSIELKAFAHADPARNDWAHQQHARFPMDPDQEFGVPRVIRSGEAALQAKITDEMLVVSARNPEQLEVWRSLHLRSGMVAPLRVRGRSIGAIAFAASDRAFGPDDLRLAIELGDRAGLAVETAQLYEAARQAVREREELMAVVSHDLRNPLSGIVMATELLLRMAAPESEEKAQRAASRVTSGVRRMERLINDLLDLARIEGGGLTVERAPFDVARLVAEALDLFSAQAAEKKQSLENDARESIMISCDRDRVLQLLANLIGNAIKFTPEGGRIVVGARPDPNGVRVWVEDSGPGVPASARPRIFERYWQVHRDKKGLGLGLTIARGVVEAHGGRIWVEGEPEKGARFVFVLAK